MFRWPVFFLFLCVVVSGCTTTATHHSSLTSTHTSAAPSPSHVASVSAARSASVNYLAPPRHTNQVWNGNKKTPTAEDRPAAANYAGTPRLAGTVVRNSAPHKALIKKSVMVGEPPEPQTASFQARQTPAQTGSISLTASPQDTQANGFVTPNAFSLAGIFGILVVLALGIWGMVWFLSYWKTLNPSSWTAGEGTYSDDSQESPPEAFSKTRSEDVTVSRPHEDTKAISRN